MSFILCGFQIKIIKSGIDKTEDFAEFNWKDYSILGVKDVVVNIVYFIIPAIIVLIVGWATGLFTKSQELFIKMMYASMYAPSNTTVLLTDLVPQSYLVSFGYALAITVIIAIILFIFFGFIRTMGESRLANTGSLEEGINISEAFKDIGRIGWGKVIAVVILIIIVIAIINAILGLLNSWISGISILSIIITPYLMFFAARAVGLLYSDIA